MKKAKQNKINKKISLIWVQKIRDRLNDYEKKEMQDFIVETPFSANISVMEFIKPILEFGEAEERRITEAFNKEGDKK